MPESLSLADVTETRIRKKALKQFFENTDMALSNTVFLRVVT
jgi:hypothetical protein